MILLLLLLNLALPPAHAARKDPCEYGKAGSAPEWWKNGRVSLDALGRSTGLNVPLSIKGLTLVQKKALFKELQAKGVFVDVHVPDEQSYEQGLVEDVGKVASYLPNAGYMKLRNGHPIHLPSVETVVLRGFAPPDVAERPMPILRCDLELEQKLSGLPDKDLSAQKRNAAGVVTFQQFLQDPEYRDWARGAVLLGIGNRTYVDTVDALKLTGYDEIYNNAHIQDRVPEFGPTTHVDLFMEEIRGRKKVFFVPRNFLKYKIDFTQSDFGDKDITKREYQWLMSRNRGTLKEVLFVYGAYDALPQGDHTAADVKAVDRALRNPTPNLVWDRPRPVTDRKD